MRILSAVVSKILTFEVSEGLEYSDTSSTDTQVTCPPQTLPACHTRKGTNCIFIRRRSPSFRLFQLSPNSREQHKTLNFALNR